MSARTDVAFSVLAGLDPLRGPPGSSSALSGAGDGSVGVDLDPEASMARIMAMPRPEAAAAAAGARRTPQWIAASQQRRARYGAIGLATAAIAVISTVLWASPSAGSPPDQAAATATTAAAVVHVAPAHAVPRP